MARTVLETGKVLGTALEQINQELAQLRQAEPEEVLVKRSLSPQREPRRGQEREIFVEQRKEKSPVEHKWSISKHKDAPAYAPVWKPSPPEENLTKELTAVQQLALLKGKKVQKSSLFSKWENSVENFWKWLTLKPVSPSLPPPQAVAQIKFPASPAQRKSDQLLALRRKLSNLEIQLREVIEQ